MFTSTKDKIQVFCVLVKVSAPATFAFLFGEILNVIIYMYMRKLKDSIPNDRWNQENYDVHHYITSVAFGVMMS